MAAIGSITAVRPCSNTTYSLGVYGATISAGQSVYQDPADSQWKLADCNATALTAAAGGIAITPGVSGGYGLIATGGNIILVGTTMVVGANYYVGGTAGGIIPDADLTTGDYVTRLGTASTATQLDMSLKVTGVVHA